MKLTAVIMVKNEIDVIRDCCGHLFALFDKIVVVDHRSTDGTKEYLSNLSEGNEKLDVYYLTEPGYYQSELMTWLSKNIESCINSDWVFLIDADEVLPFLSREEMERALESYETNPIIKMPWKNLVPMEYTSSAIMGRSYLESKASTIYHKVAYQPSLIPVSDYIIAQGNHAILAGGTGKELPSITAFNLYHVPIRSQSQLGFKVIQGTAAYSAMGEGRNKSLGSHWFDISKHINKYGIKDEFLNGIAFKYGESIDVNKINISHEQLLQKGYGRITLDYAYQELPDVSESINNIEKVIKMLSDMQEASFSYINSEDDVFIELNNDREIIFMGNKKAPYYKGLPERKKIECADSDVDLLTSFLEPAASKIESLTPTAWGGHIPFLFCLFSLLKPRIYVELGSHYGASFFAACQSLQKYKIDGKALAVDLWEGDEHAGYYSETVFKSFQYILTKKYSDVGEALRMTFDEASNLFEENSIDLLHIDGLHTYEAVKNDYETWKDKAAKNSVIIFHDTNVFEREFGVWKLWKEISNEAVSFEFKHTHGLGVLAFGSSEENPVVRLLSIVNGSEILSDYFESFFSRMGELTTNEAMSNIGGEVSSDRPASKLRSVLQAYKSSLRNRMINFIKSVPFLKRTAYSILRFVRR